jgi:hydroxymethylpyrimidine pyrophosphatase-like HAD family hydrolase
MTVRLEADLLGREAVDWLRLGDDLPAGCVRLVLSDVDGVITRGEGQPVDLDVIVRIAATNVRALGDPLVPAVTLCTGRQAPYVELMAQLTHTFLPCIFEHGAGLFFPRAFRYAFDPLLGAEYAARLAHLRAALEPGLLAPGRAFVQPGKEATMTLYPLDGTPLEEVFQRACQTVAQAAPGFGVERNAQGVEIRPRGIDKGVGLGRVAEVLGLSTDQVAGIGDSDPDLSFLHRVGFSAAPANATRAVQAAVGFVARGTFGQGLLEVLHALERRNRSAS